ncbi:MAG: HEAT repeat domain-containing protein, partial [Culicoidibacterales bacterium]
ALHETIARNPKAPQALLEAAVASQERYLVRAAAANPSIVAFHDLFFAKHQDDTIRLTFAQNPRLPLEYIYYLSADEKAAVRQAVLTHPNLTTSLRELCRYHRTYKLPVHASENMIRQDFFEALITLTPKTLVRLIKRNLFEPAMVALLVDHEDYTVRREIARSQVTLTEVLTKLAADEEVAVRQAVAKNPVTPAQLLEKLNDDIPSVRRALAENPAIPAYLLEIVLHSADASVLAIAVANPNLTPVELMLYSLSTIPLVRRNVAKNPVTPAEILSRLAKDQEVCVREQVAKNQKTPLQIIYQLTEDSDPIVSRNAIRTYDYWAQAAELRF